jgi:hypothetical protein
MVERTLDYLNERYHYVDDNDYFMEYLCARGVWKHFPYTKKLKKIVIRVTDSDPKTETSRPVVFRDIEDIIFYSVNPKVQHPKGEIYEKFELDLREHFVFPRGIPITLWVDFR